jgi:hypothetical protein
MAKQSFSPKLAFVTYSFFTILSRADNYLKYKMSRINLDLFLKSSYNQKDIVIKRDLGYIKTLA